MLNHVISIGFSIEKIPFNALLLKMVLGILNYIDINFAS